MTKEELERAIQLEVSISELDNAINQLIRDDPDFNKTLKLKFTYREDYDESQEALINHLVKQRNKFQKELDKL